MDFEGLLRIASQQQEEAEKNVCFQVVFSDSWGQRQLTLQALP